MNGSESVEIAKDKLYSLQILAQNGIAVPKTILLRFPLSNGVEPIIKRLGLPIIIKCLSGMQGKGVFMAKTKDELQTYADLLESVNPNHPMYALKYLVPYGLWLVLLISLSLSLSGSGLKL